jgi:integrase
LVCYLRGIWSKKTALEEWRLYETRYTFATLTLDGEELTGWVQKMMGYETLQMIHDRYYSYIKNYQRDDGRAFMENVYKTSCAQEDEESDEKSGLDTN